MHIVSYADPSRAGDGAAAYATVAQRQHAAVVYAAACAAAGARNVVDLCQQLYTPSDVHTVRHADPAVAAAAGASAAVAAAVRKP